MHVHDSSATTPAASAANGDIAVCTSNIVARVDAWLRKTELLAPGAVKRRRQAARGIRGMLRTVLGALIPLSLPEVRKLHIFEGLRNREFCAAFPPGEVLIVGSHAERKFAADNGYSFAWSFPFAGAVNTTLTRGWPFFLYAQIRRWTRELRRYDSVAIFVYEDTQPVGSFLASVGKLAGGGVKVVCIQHGYFCETTTARPLDGEISEFNFLWDHNQLKLIGCNRDSSIITGPPCTAVAQRTDCPSIVFVGTGSLYDGTDDYERSLRWYKAVLSRLPPGLQSRAYYRPHPNELIEARTRTRLQGLFPNLDLLPLTDRLADSEAVFVGSISSVLYEAGVAGHMIAHVDLQPNFRPIFGRDRDFSENDVERASEWLQQVCKDGGFVRSTRTAVRELDFRTAAERVLSTAQRP